MDPDVDACEWGRRQAAASPRWSEDQWRRVAALLGTRLAAPPAADRSQAGNDQPVQAA